MTGKIRRVSQIWILFAAIAFLLAAATITIALQKTRQNRIDDYLAAESALDCANAEASATGLTGIYSIGLGEDRSMEISNFLDECRKLGEARASFQSGDFAGAQNQYWGFATQYPSSPFVPTVSREGQDSYLGIAEAKHASGEYEEALKLFSQFLENFPKYPFGQRAKNGYAATLEDWVGHLRGLHQFEQALSTCGTYAVDTIPATVKWCIDQKPVILFEWGADEYAAGLREEAASQFFELLALIDPASPIYADMLQQYPDVMLAWAGDLRTKGHLLKSFEVLSALKEIQSDPEFQKLVDEEYAQTLHDLAEDTGEDGRTVLRQALAAVCSQGDTPLPPAIGYIKDAPHRGYYCPADSDMYTYYPESRLAAKPSELYFYVRFSSSSDVVDQCQYMGFHTLVRKRYKLTVYVMLVSSQKERSHNTFYGLNPVACPSSYSFGTFESEKSLYGSPVNPTQVKTWLESVIH